MSKFKYTKSVVALAATAVLALVLTACGSTSDTAANSDHNDQDIAFAQGMIPHHGQAIQMAKLAATRASSTEVKDLATKIEAAQQPEIDTMNGWLKSWGKAEVNPTGTMDHSMHGAEGMMSSTDMSAMQAMSGVNFDRMFLNGMIAHHEGAIAMAKTQQQQGKFEPAKSMASSIISSQQAEINQMKQLLL